jgi:hypothetical protein
VADGFHLATVDAVHELTADTEHFQTPVAAVRNMQWEAQRFRRTPRQGADELDSVSIQRLSGKRITRSEAQNVAAIARDDVCCKWEATPQLCAESSARNPFTDDEGSRSANVDDVVTPQLLGEDAGTDPSIAADVDSFEEYDQRHLLNVNLHFRCRICAYREDEPSRAPISAPIPMSAVLKTGPIGLLNVFTAIAAARRKPTAAPTAVILNRDCSIHPRDRAIAAAPIHPSSPPTTPPTHSPFGPAA